MKFDVAFLVMVGVGFSSGFPAQQDLSAPVVFQEGNVQQVKLPTGRFLVEDNTEDTSSPNCKSILSRSLPECQESSNIGRFGDIWGEISVDVSSGPLKIVEPEDRKKKRKEKFKTISA
ncbi:uncharacterized protein LOC111695105 [Eurytemora carolleeae]|uniref:uncharacterized protein LOC111695105 n=1 Tax=Eurytemora carolleeae TaxID=1294199 RepID=UPI000C790D53|nr:uncharacterized protein LOC111695105 [Eurytemora carolleeae]|eukprot:XP_023320064.1 uncharacterized protein LOC111695105 [Eurytemora affinis]